MKDFLNSIKEKWNNLSKTKKSIIIVAIIAVFLSSFFLYRELTKIQYSTLFSNLDPKTASGVTEKLDDLKIPYKITNQGKTILVSEDKVYDARIQLAGAGVLTETGLGFEIFDKTKLGSTDFERNVDYQRALQGELRRTIISFEEIEDARVHINPSKESLYSEEELVATAAVQINLKPLAKLNEEQVKGIVYLVSSSIQNLSPENVRVIDSKGIVLSDSVDFTKKGLSTKESLTKFEIKRTYEKDLEKRVLSMLSRIYGASNVVAMISTELDFDHFEEKETDYGESSILSEEASESSSSSIAGSSNTAGMDSQINNYGSGGSGDSESSSTDTTKNYKVDQRDTMTVKAPGQVKNIATSVVVNGQLGEQQILQVQNMIASAIGFNAARGDQINVTSMAFDTDDEVAEEPNTNKNPQLVIEPYIKWIAIGAGALLLLFIIWRFIMARKRRRQEKELNDLMNGNLIEEEVPVIPVSPELEVVPEAPKNISLEDKMRKEKQEKIRDIVRDKPEEAAELIKTWLIEE